MTRIACLLIFFCFVACKSAPKVDNPDPNAFGESFTPENVIDIPALLAQLASQDTVLATVKGNVESVCKKKGCWMNLAPEGMVDQEIFVKFKDYGFFMPLDCEGKEMIMHGKAFKEVTTVEELQHYAEDEGKSKEEIEAITQPIEEYKFVADGVIMTN